MSIVWLPMRTSCVSVIDISKSVNSCVCVLLILLTWWRSVILNAPLNRLERPLEMKKLRLNTEGIRLHRRYMGCCSFYVGCTCDMWDVLASMWAVSGAVWAVTEKKTKTDKKTKSADSTAVKRNKKWKKYGGIRKILTPSGLSRTRLNRNQ